MRTIFETKRSDSTLAGGDGQRSTTPANGSRWSGSPFGSLDVGGCRVRTRTPKICMRTGVDVQGLKIGQNKPAKSPAVAVVIHESPTTRLPRQQRQPQHMVSNSHRQPQEAENARLRATCLQGIRTPANPRTLVRGHPGAPKWARMGPDTPNSYQAAKCQPAPKSLVDGWRAGR